jgi:hypothetical protein
MSRLVEFGRQVAELLQIELVPAPEGAQSVTLKGKNYQIIISDFFGGWQAHMKLAGRPDTVVYGEDVKTMALNIRNKLTNPDA